MKLILLTLVTFVGGLSFQAYGMTESAKKKSGTRKDAIVCSIVDNDEESQSDFEIAKVTVLLDQQGVASAVRLQRTLRKDKQNDFLATTDLDLKFDDRMHLISHGIKPNQVASSDEKGLVFEWGIRRVEVISARNEAGDSAVELTVNDHLYSGTPGSAIKYTFQGKQYKFGGPFVFCDGAVKFPLKK